MIYSEYYHTYQEILFNFLKTCSVEEWKTALERFEYLHQNVVRDSRFNNVPVKFWLLLVEMDCLAGILFLCESLNEAPEIAVLGAAGCVRVSSMLSWLAHWAGNYKIRDESFNIFYQYSKVLERYENLEDYEPLVLARARALTQKGYTREARNLVKAIIKERKGSLEIADVCWALWDKSPIQAALDTKDFIFKEHTFVPIIHLYCSSLLKINRDREVEDILKDLPEKLLKHPLILDIRASLAQNIQNWELATQLYSQSSWSIHHYVKLITQCIAYPEQDFSEEWEAFLKSDHTYVMNSTDSEIRQEYDTRFIQYVKYISQVQFDSFYSLFETGQLMFRKRRYREAYRCFTRAWKSCITFPPKSFFDVHFANATWLTDYWNCKPEVYELTYHFLAHYPETSESVRNWAFREELIGKEQLEPIFKSTDHYERGEAFLLLNQESSAIREFWLFLEKNYYPRAIHNLISYYKKLGFYKVVDFLAQKILQESHDSFFDLWELAKCLADLVVPSEVYDAPHYTTLLKALEQAEDGMLKTALKDFQNLIRLIRYYKDTSRLTEAQMYLEKSFGLAETAEDFLAIAQEWRFIKGNITERDNLGEKSLTKASIKSRDRTEKLEIAAEFCNYYLISDARQILVNLNIVGEHFNINLDLLPLEWIFVLSCERCLSKEEIEELVSRAFRSLNIQINGKVLCYKGELFLDRLRDKIQGLNKLDGKEIWHKLQQQSTIQEGKIQNNISKNKEEKDREKELNRKIKEDFYYQTYSGEKRKWKDFYDAFFSLFTKENHLLVSQNYLDKIEDKKTQELLDYWRTIFSNYREEKNKLLEVKIPKLTTQELPMALSKEREELLVQLWRTKLLGDERSRSAAAAQILEFYQKEISLQSQWKKRLTQYCEGFRSSIEILATAGKNVLEKIENQVKIERTETFYEQKMLPYLMEDLAILKEWLTVSSASEKASISSNQYAPMESYPETGYGADSIDLADQDANTVKNSLELNTKKIFQEMLQHFNQAAAKNIDVSYQFEIHGNFEAAYTLSIKDGNCYLATKKIDVPSLTISISDRDWFSICEGYLTSKEAFLKKQLKLSGDINTAVKIVELFNI
jgi:putative sterol carrier protein